MNSNVRPSVADSVADKDRMRQCRLLIGMFLFLSAAGCSDRSADQNQSATDISPAGSTEKAGDERAAAEAAERATADMKRAEAAIAAGKRDQAFTHLLAIPRDGSTVSQEAAVLLAELYRTAGQLAPAADSLHYVLRHQPGQSLASQGLADLLVVTGQRAAADRLLFGMIRQQPLKLKQLILLTDFERRHPADIRFLEECAQKAESDPLVSLGLAIDEFQQKDLAASRRRLTAIVAERPDLATAQGLLGEILVEDSPLEFPDWHAALPRTVSGSPEVWLARGMWARAASDLRTAARCFWESARQTPTSYRAIYLLGTTLTDVDRPMSEVYLKSAEQIFKMRQALSSMLNSGGQEEQASQVVIKLLVEMGREWEAWNWTQLASQRFSGGGMAGGAEAANGTSAQCGISSTAAGRQPDDQVSPGSVSRVCRAA